MSDLIDRGFPLIAAWYPAQLRKLGRWGRKPDAADYLWDRMVDVLLSAAKNYDGRMPFERYLGWCVRRARANVVAWVRARGRLGERAWPVNEKGRPYDPADDCGVELADLAERWDEVARLLGPADHALIKAWAERRGAEVAGERGLGRSAFNERVRRLLQRIRARVRGGKLG